MGSSGTVSEYETPCESGVHNAQTTYRVWMASGSETARRPGVWVHSLEAACSKQRDCDRTHQLRLAVQESTVSRACQITTLMSSVSAEDKLASREVGAVMELNDASSLLSRH